MKNLIKYTLGLPLLLFMTLFMAIPIIAWAFCEFCIFVLKIDGSTELQDGIDIIKQIWEPF